MNKKPLLWHGTTLIFAAALLFYGYSTLQMNATLSNINQHQIEECTYLDCQTQVFGGVTCKPEPVPDQNMQPIPDPGKAGGAS